ncbi:MAG: phosphatidylserine decarboxylase [Hyphomicrobiaceae bacterium]|nr:phosphatidylserine decarboxylase [Hyphomicrobiaceae bacterium]
MSRDLPTLLETATSLVPPVNADGHKFIAAGAAATVLLGLLWGTLGWIAALVTVLLVAFFRDPPRVTPLRAGLVTAAADGIVTAVETLAPPMELGLGSDPRCRIVTRLALTDVHVNRAPVAGRVARSIYVPGAFVSVTSDKASEDNERRATVIEQPSGDEIAVVQIAGMLARRIVTFVHEGDSVGIGQRLGLIRFGSRVDVYLPVGATALVAVGQRMVAGETVLADLVSSEAEREARRT